ncbi:ATP-dependent nuclease [Edaphobacter aggregans]|uniref:ATP-dependent nuclease n=1 Tax=Edaphobacter aggregans TaxID=570835 RepID=UPI000B21AF36|nr:AAA family ATPase [Edaphobacter aggregans]
MQICCLTIKNFRGIKNATIYPPQHAVLLGDNNTGKTTILEAIDLALGPDRLNRTPPIDEHDFYQGKYLAATSVPPAPAIPSPPPFVNANLPPTLPAPFLTSAEPPKIEIEVTISHLTQEQKARSSSTM